MLTWVVTFREHDSGEMLPLKVLAPSMGGAERAALAQLAAKLESREITGSWALYSIRRTQS